MNKTRSLWLPIIIAVLALAWRVAKLHFGWHNTLANFAPWMALAFAGSMVMPKQMPWWFWPALMLGCDILVQPGDIAGTWLMYLCLGAAAITGSLLRKRASITALIGGTVACSIAFYLITSTQAWWMNPVYAKTASGWWQAMIYGDPAWQPQAWVFLVRSLISDVGFSLLLLLAYNGEAGLRQGSPLRFLAPRAA